MALLAIEEIGNLLHPYYPDHSPHLLERLSAYLDLLAKWNSRTNLTAIRDPREIVRRHFGESLFAAAHLPPCRSLLDLGSGAGFPGLPIALAKPDLQVVLAESQNKKASFLMEARRVLNIKVEIWAFRVELIQPEKLFDVVTLRAVDNMKLALVLASNRLVDSGTIVQFVPSAEADIGDLPLPGDLGSALRFISGVPRGTISLTQ